MIACALALVLLLTSVLLLPAKPALAANDTTGRGIGYTAELYNNTNGLPTSDANAVVQTAEGFIWIGSYSGLIRYDGNTFYRYDSSTGISSVVSLYVDSKNRLWIGTNDRGVFVMEEGELTEYGLDEGLKSLSIRAILEDGAGNTLVATTAGMAYVDAEGLMHPLDDERINNEYVCELEKGADGLIYGLTNSGILFTLQNTSIVSFYEHESLVDGLINSIYPDPDAPGGIYFGMNDARVIYGSLENNMKDATSYSVAPQKTVASVTKIDGQIWICADNGIGYFDGDAYIPLTDLPMNNSVEHIFTDYENNLWFTSSRQGLMKITRNRFTDISLLASLPSLVVNTTWMKDGMLYLGTDTGLYIVDSSFDQVKNEMTEKLDGVRIRTIGEDSKGRLWFGTNSDDALLCYDLNAKEWTSYNTSNGLATDRARTFKELSDGRMAVATNGGVNIIENGEVVRLYAAADGLRNLEILCLEEGDNGDIYAGSDGDGIYIIDGDTVSHVGIEEGLESDVILRIVKDPNEAGLFWVVTSNSLAYIRGGEVHTIHSFPYSNNFDLKFDTSGRMWVLSSIGLYVVKRDEMLADENLSYSLYDIESGLPSVSTANSYNCLTEDGTLYLACTSGTSAINIFNDHEIDGEVRLAIPFVMADNEMLYVKDNEVEIPSNCRKLVIYAYAFTYTLNNPHLRYQMEGFDEKAEALVRSDMDPVVYTNLPGGSYTFHFAMVDTMADEESDAVELTIIKDKRLTEQLWFWIGIAVLGAALLLLIVSFIFRRKHKALQKKEKEHRALINELAAVFAKVIDKKDAYTNGHSQRVAQYTVMLAKQLGKTEEELDKIYHIALLHDVGKIGIPDEILNKPGRLDDDEFAVMKTHSAQGYEILKEISIEPELAIGAGFHHERLDGKGYPRGLKADDIPEIAQIIAVADTFDAMFSTRPYRKKMELSDIEAEVLRVSGTQLNPTVVNALVELIHAGAFDRAREEVK